jgi:hypothetical protein
MRKFSAVILLLLFAAIQMGTLTWYCYRPILHSVCYQLFFYRLENPRSPVTHLKLSRAAFHAARCDDDEIRCNGELYDIIRTVAHGDTLLLTVEKDITETRWLAACSAIQQQLTQNRPGQNPAHSRVYQWMFKQYVPSREPPSFESIRETPLPCSHCATPLLSSGFHHLPGKPPEQAC